MKNPLISIIIPIYKVEKYLRQCIESVVSQTYTNLEIILVDDGSPDGCPAICDEYAEKDKRIKVIHQKNGGLSDARNTGIAKSTGDLLFFLDSDDRISNDCINCLYCFLVENNLDIACGGVCKTYSNGKLEFFTKSGNKIYNSIEASYDIHLTQKILTTAWNKLIKREIFNGIVFPKGKINEDEFVTYKLILNAKKIGYIDSLTYFYFQRENGIMNSNMPYENFDVIAAFDERKTIYQKFNNRKLIECVDYIKLNFLFECSKRTSMLTNEKINYLLKHLKFSFFFNLPFNKQIKAIIKFFLIIIRLNLAKR